MFICMYVTELMVFIFIDSISLPCFENCLVAILFFLLSDFFFCIILTLLPLGSLMELNDL